MTTAQSREKFCIYGRLKVIKTFSVWGYGLEFGWLVVSFGINGIWALVQPSELNYLILSHLNQTRLLQGSRVRSEATHRE